MCELPDSVYSSSLFTKDCLKENKYYFVKAVCDGDTISLTSCDRSQKEKKIRLLGIDAFESKQGFYGKEAKDFLTNLVLNKNVCIETDIEEKDKYERTLGYVFINESLVFINEELLKTGHAILYSFPPNIKYINKLKKAQIFARQNMLGIWEKQDYIIETPAQWRYKHKN